MANTAAPFGFRQFGQREGSAPTAGQEVRLISSAYTGLIFSGDVVQESSGAPGYVISAGSTSGTGAVAASITSIAYGIFQGCRYFNTNVNRVVWSSFWPGSGASGDSQAFICSNPEQLYIAQGSTGGVLGSTNIGMAVPMSIINSSLGNQTTGQSVMTVQSSLVTGLSTAGQFMIVDLYSNTAPPGVNGTSTGAEGLQIVVLQPSNFIRKTVTGGVLASS